jgi:hypothetical protein
MDCSPIAAAPRTSPEYAPFWRRHRIPGWTALIRRGVERSIVPTGINSYRVFELAGVDLG